MKLECRASSSLRLPELPAASTSQPADAPGWGRRLQAASFHLEAKPLQRKKAKHVLPFASITGQVKNVLREDCPHKRQEECTRWLFRRMARGKETLLERDVRQFAREHGFPEDYVQPFYASLQQSLPSWDSGENGVCFRVFRKYVMAREKALHRVFDTLDHNKDGRISVRDMRIGLCNLNVHCENSRCGYRSCKKMVDKFFDANMPNGEYATFCDFRRLFLLLPREGMKEEYWIKAGDPSCCDLRGNLPHAESAHKASASPWGHLLAGAVAGAASRTATAPLETLRLMAMTGAMKPTKSAGHLFSSACDVAKAHGWRALYRGNLANVARSAPQKALDFFAFDAFKSALAPRPRSSSPPRAGTRSAATAAAQPGTAVTLAAAGLAGAMSNVILYPLEVVRTRLSTDSTGAYKGVGHAFSSILHREGPRAFYRGLGPSVGAILPEAAITYGLFDILKRCYVHWSGREEAGVAASLAAGVIAAFTGQAVAYPLETVSRRMQMSTSAGTPAAALGAILHEGGFPALFRGLGAASIRVVPMAIVSFGTYEFMRSQYNRMEDQMALMSARRQQQQLPAASEACHV